MPDDRDFRLSALGNAGSENYIGLEVIDLDEGIQSVTFTSDEFTALCPVTKQADLYELTIELSDTLVTIESKSLKIFLHTYRNKGKFCENLALEIKAQVFDAIERHLLDSATFHEDQVHVTIIQKARGGIRIEAVA